MFLASDQRDIVVFKFWPSLAYGARMALAIALVVTGLALQFLLHLPSVGAVAIFAGNLLLLVTGYDNRVNFNAFDPSTEWQRVGRDKLVELQELNRKIVAWDSSALDITNVFGFFVFLLVAGVLGIGFMVAEGLARTLFADGLVLLVPHWITGTRSILVLPGLLVKTNFILELTDKAAQALGDHQLGYLMNFTGGETPMPNDVKIKVTIAGQHEDFLGLYGQLVTNDVRGSSYPYFYVVLVAKRGYGLRDFAASVGGHLIVEQAPTEEVDVMVIRQLTTKTSGYHTDVDAACEILEVGVRAAASAARAPVA